MNDKTFLPEQRLPANFEAHRVAVERTEQIQRGVGHIDEACAAIGISNVHLEQTPQTRTSHEKPSHVTRTETPAPEVDSQQNHSLEDLNIMSIRNEIKKIAIPEDEARRNVQEANQ